MNHLRWPIILIILFSSCKTVTKYTLLVRVEDLKESGEKEIREIKDVILQTSDSLAYFDGSASFLVYKNSFDLNGYQMSMGRPVDFTVLNTNGADVRKRLNATAVNFIDEYYVERYNRAKPLIEKRKKIMLKQMNEK